MAKYAFITIVTYLNGRVDEHEFRSFREADNFKYAIVGNRDVRMVRVERHDICRTL